MKIEKLIKKVQALNVVQMRKITGGNSGNDTTPPDDETNEQADGVIQNDPIAI